jgi:hypothetical protein
VSRWPARRRITGSGFGRTPALEDGEALGKGAAAREGSEDGRAVAGGGCEAAKDGSHLGDSRGGQACQDVDAVGKIEGVDGQLQRACRQSRAEPHATGRALDERITPDFPETGGDPLHELLDRCGRFGTELIGESTGARGRGGNGGCIDRRVQGPSESVVTLGRRERLSLGRLIQSEDDAADDRAGMADQFAHGPDAKAGAVPVRSWHLTNKFTESCRRRQVNLTNIHGGHIRTVTVDPQQQRPNVSQGDRLETHHYIGLRQTPGRS